MRKFIICVCILFLVEKFYLVLFEEEGSVSVVEQKKAIGENIKIGSHVLVKHGVKKYQALVKAEGKKSPDAFCSVLIPHYPTRYLRRNEEGRELFSPGKYGDGRCVIYVNFIIMLWVGECNPV